MLKNKMYFFKIFHIGDFYAELPYIMKLNSISYDIYNAKIHILNMACAGTC